jgi:uncharacterized protein YdaU (DUF1376 family)
VADYLKKTTHLGALESGAYLHLIMDYWANGKLPTDEKQLARIAKLTDKEWRRCRDTLAAFFTADWKHERIDEELAKAADISSKRRANAMQLHSKQDANAPANAHTLHSSQSPRKKEREERDARASRGASLPDGWTPSEEDFAYVENLGLSRSQALEGLEEMRLWAGANRNRSVGRKADWSLTYRSWMRRNKRGTNAKTARDQSRDNFRTALDQLRNFGEAGVGGEDGSSPV